MSDIILALRKATKLYAGVPAIENVDFELRRGEIHALVGENGAGKSTLTKVMAGVVTLTSGTMEVDGVEAAPRHAARSPPSRHRDGLSGDEPGSDVDRRAEPLSRQESFFNRLRGLYIAAQQFLQSLKFRRHPTVTVSLLGAAKKQMVEIARAVAARGPRHHLRRADRHA